MSTILSLHDLPKELVDLIAKAILDLKSWLSLRLTCKRCWTLCSLEQYRVQFLVQVKLEEKTYGMLPNKLKHGVYKVWHINGQLEQQCFYRDNRLEGKYKEWYENGQLCSRSFRKDGNFEGEYKAWHINGQLEQQCFYRDDRLEGEFKRWYETGQLWIQCFYKNDRIEGVFKKWYMNGRLQHHHFYKNGQPV
jgi:antitoxin component YwqK of YwqJK toxin-antitoxin module